MKSAQEFIAALFEAAAARGNKATPAAFADRDEFVLSLSSLVEAHLARYSAELQNRRVILAIVDHPTCTSRVAEYGAHSASAAIPTVLTYLQNSFNEYLSGVVNARSNDEDAPFFREPN